eukprot:GHVQ01031416.1.p1 GENE.GHVQ01031416.1~~GHVQ01031416.1.p1  ORF type:complete len:351 (-),score=99.82 GHVQ01031416.1:60-1112(-)
MISTATAAEAATEAAGASLAALEAAAVVTRSVTAVGFHRKTHLSPPLPPQPRPASLWTTTTWTSHTTRKHYLLTTLICTYIMFLSSSCTTVHINSNKSDCSHSVWSCSSSSSKLISLASYLWFFSYYLRDKSICPCLFLFCWDHELQQPPPHPSSSPNYPAPAVDHRPPPRAPPPPPRVPHQGVIFGTALEWTFCPPSTNTAADSAANNPVNSVPSSLPPPDHNTRSMGGDSATSAGRGRHHLSRRNRQQAKGSSAGVIDDSSPAGIVQHPATDSNELDGGSSGASSSSRGSSSINTKSSNSRSGSTSSSSNCTHYLFLSPQLAVLQNRNEQQQLARFFFIHIPSLSLSS